MLCAAFWYSLISISIGIYRSQLATVEDIARRELEKLIEVSECPEEPTPSPQPQFRIYPSYPEDAEASAVEGFAVVAFQVDVNGIVSQVQTERSAPNGVFEDAVRCRALRLYLRDDAIDVDLECDNSEAFDRASFGVFGIARIYPELRLGGWRGFFRALGDLDELLQLAARDVFHRCKL